MLGTCKQLGVINFTTGFERWQFLGWLQTELVVSNDHFAIACSGCSYLGLDAGYTIILGKLPLDLLLDPIIIGVLWIIEPSLMILAEVSWPELNIAIVADFEIPALTKYCLSCDPLNIVNPNPSIPQTCNCQNQTISISKWSQNSNVLDQSYDSHPSDETATKFSGPTCMQAIQILAIKV